MTTHGKRWLFSVTFLLGAVPGIPDLASAATFDLKADRVTQPMPDGSLVEMWGFGLLADLEVSVPGPVLVVPPGDTTLTINLTNNLDVPVSIVIPGQAGDISPVWDDGSTGARPSLTARAVAFSTETAANATGVYSWSNLSPGTYLYQSGSHVAVQVQMGLFGVLTADAAVGAAYPGLAYDNAATVVLSEVDPALHAAVADGSYGTADYPSTINYAPRYFFINGAAYPDAIVDIATDPTVGQRVFLRMLNAGYDHRSVVLRGAYMDLVAEDGRPYPYARRQYNVFLPAGKTADALWLPEAEGTFALYDRRLGLSDPSASSGGMLAHLTVVASAGAPVAVSDSYTLDEDSSLDTAAAALPGVLANDSGAGALSAEVVTPPQVGSFALAPDGSFVYTPAPDFNGQDQFTYRATDGVLWSNTSTVDLMVAGINDAPVAADDALDGTEGVVLMVSAPGLLANDTDVDGDTLFALLVDAPLGGLLTLSSNGSLEYLPDPGTIADSFTYVANDGSLDSNLATVTLSLAPAVNAAPVAVDDFASTQQNVGIDIVVLANDYDPDGSLDVSSVAIITQPTRRGTATANPDGTVSYVPSRNFRGTDVFPYTVLDDVGAVSNEAAVHVNVVK
jgi:FtsP/CotA-like multicopper oxidase with cupredoxin domain